MQGYGKKSCERVKDILSSQIESFTGEHDHTTLLIAKSRGKT